MWCITSFFNPSNYQTPLRNYHVFAENIKRQGAKLLTLELAFEDMPFQIPDAHHLRSNSIMWQKERLINYGMSLIPNEPFAWIDADVVFSDDDWITKTLNLLNQHDLIQLFKRVFYLPKDDCRYSGCHKCCFSSFMWQVKRYPDWLKRRINKDLPFGAPGFAWASKNKFYLYDKDIAGSGDCILVDSIFDSWRLHGYDRKFNDITMNSIEEWSTTVKGKTCSYLPTDIFHLWHGEIRNRGYLRRHKPLIDSNFDPDKDIIIKNGVFEWATDKPEMHRNMKNYFFERKEDEE